MINESQRPMFIKQDNQVQDEIKNENHYNDNYERHIYKTNENTINCDNNINSNDEKNKSLEQLRNKNGTIFSYDKFNKSIHINDNDKQDDSSNGENGWGKKNFNNNDRGRGRGRGRGR